MVIYSYSFWMILLPPLSLKTLLNQVNLLEASPEVANVILELGTMIE